MKEFLSRAGVSFTVMNVDEDDRAYDALLATGLRTVPVTLLRGRLIKGFDPATLQKAIEEL